MYVIASSLKSKNWWQSFLGQNFNQIDSNSACTVAVEWGLLLIVSVSQIAKHIQYSCQNKIK